MTDSLHLDQMRHADPAVRLRGWLKRWRALKISPPAGLTDDIRDAAEWIEQAQTAAAESERVAKAGPQAATEPPWGNTS